MEEDLFNTKPAERSDTPLTLAEAARDAEDHVTNLSDQLTKSKKLSKILNDLIDHQRDNRPLHIKLLCEKEAQFLKSLREEKHPAILVTEKLYREMEPIAKDAIKNLPADLEQMAKATGLVLDFSKSRHPKYCFEESGFIQVEIQDRKQEAKISTREGLLAKIPADASAIVAKVKDAKSRLFDRPFAGPKFLSDLRSAYSSAIQTAKVADGDPIPLRQIYKTMTGKFKARKAYKQDEFLVDLSRLVMEGPAETKGYRFELQQTKDTEEGMLLLGEAGRGMVSLLIFKKSTQQEL